MILGFVGGRFLHIDRKPIAQVLIYLVAPFIVFHTMAANELSSLFFVVPFLIFGISSIATLFFLFFGKKFFGGDVTNSNLAAFTSGAANTGYFGVPVAVALFGEKALLIVILSMMGTVMFEFIVGYYVIARGHYSAMESFKRARRLPTLYAFFLGLICNYFNMPVTESMTTFFSFFKGTYFVLGFMMIGLGLSHSFRAAFDLKFILGSFFGKFIIWPTMMFLFILVDSNYLHFYNYNYSILFMISLVPVAVNSVVFATELGVRPEKAALAVILSTIFALLYIPVMLYLFERYYL